MYKVTNPSVDGPFYRMFAEMYEQMSVKPLPSDLGGTVLPFFLQGINKFLKKVYKVYGQEPPCVNYIHKNHAMVSQIPSSEKVLVAFSGGKDSLATALKLKKLNYDVQLCHISGVNRSYPHEIIYSRKLASEIKMTLTQMAVRVSGKGDYMENPVKNFFILAMMVEHGLVHGIRKFAFGCDDHLGSTVNPDYNLSDSVELFNDLEEFYRRYIPGFQVLLPIANGTDSYWTIYETRPDLFRKRAFSSCMMPLYRKKRVREANIKSGVVLESSRCGSCKKCAYEYIHALLFGEAKLNKDYLKKCVQILQRKALTNDPSGTTFSEDQAIRKFVDLDFLQGRASNISKLASFLQ